MGPARTWVLVLTERRDEADGTPRWSYAVVAPGGSAFSSLVSHDTPEVGIERLRETLTEIR
jgi:hypothetical protein